MELLLQILIGAASIIFAVAAMWFISQKSKELYDNRDNDNGGIMH